jgi:hypothetical protein
MVDWGRNPREHDAHGRTYLPFIGEDEGQMAVITGTQKVIVEIAWKSGSDGHKK